MSVKKLRPTTTFDVASWKCKLNSADLRCFRLNLGLSHRGLLLLSQRQMKNQTIDINRSIFCWCFIHRISSNCLTFFCWSHAKAASQCGVLEWVRGPGCNDNKSYMIVDGLTAVLCWVRRCRKIMVARLSFNLSPNTCLLQPRLNIIPRLNRAPGLLGRSFRTQFGEWQVWWC